jgi:hypothetical protein
LSLFLMSFTSPFTDNWQCRLLSALAYSLLQYTWQQRLCNAHSVALVC